MDAKSVIGWVISLISLGVLLFVLFSPILPHRMVDPVKALMGDFVTTFEKRPAHTGSGETVPTPPDQSLLQINSSINNLWVTVALILVMFMQPGFAFLESGLMRFGSVINVLFKNVIDFCLNGIFFFYIGYSLMWNGSSTEWQLHGNFDVGWLPVNYSPNGIVPPIHFLFQLVFAMTAATICSGCVAGRIKPKAYFIATVIISTLIYPISGFWAWSADANGPIGFLARIGYHDFAGSSVVHVVGGFAGLAGAIILGPRLGRFPNDPRLAKLRRERKGQIPGLSRYDQGIHKAHSFTSATLGTFLLWVGWFGFNGGSALAMANGKERVVGFVLINTMLAACGGGVIGSFAPFLFNWLHSKEFKTKPYYAFDGTLNGIIGGLVSITAGCNLIEKPLYAVAIGGAGGALVYFSTFVLSNLRQGWRVDDPVGAFSVHGVCGIFGVMVCPILPGSTVGFLTQTVGCALICAWSFGVSFMVFWLLKTAHILRSTEEDEVLGLDVVYHGQPAYTLEVQYEQKQR